MTIRHGDDDAFMPTRQRSQEAFLLQRDSQDPSAAAATQAHGTTSLPPAERDVEGGREAVISGKGACDWDLDHVTINPRTRATEQVLVPDDDPGTQPKAPSPEPRSTGMGLSRALSPGDVSVGYPVASSLGSRRRFIYALGGARGRVGGEGDPKYEGYLAASRGAWQYDTALQTWQAIAPMSQMRSMAASCAFEGRCIIAGGFDNDHETTCRVEAYNARSGAWERMPRLVVPRDSFALVSVDEQVLAIGGWDHRHRLVADVERFDASRDRWIPDSKQPMGVPRGGLAAIALDGLVYCAGGFEEDARVSDTVEVYNALLGTWAPASSLCRKRAMCAGVAYGGILYVGGGLDETSGHVLASVERFDPATQTW